MKINSTEELSFSVEDINKKLSTIIIGDKIGTSLEEIHTWVVAQKEILDKAGPIVEKLEDEKTTPQEKEGLTKQLAELESQIKTIDVKFAALPKLLKFERPSHVVTPHGVYECQGEVKAEPKKDEPAEQPKSNKELIHDELKRIFKNIQTDFDYKYFGTKQTVRVSVKDLDTAKKIIKSLEQKPNIDMVISALTVPTTNIYYLVFNNMSLEKFKRINSLTLPPVDEPKQDSKTIHANPAVDRQTLAQVAAPGKKAKKPEPKSSPQPTVETQQSPKVVANPVI